MKMSFWAAMAATFVSSALFAGCGNCNCSRSVGRASCGKTTTVTDSAVVTNYDFKEFNVVNAGKVPHGRDRDLNGDLSDLLMVNIVPGDGFGVELSVEDGRFSDLFDVTQRDSELIIWILDPKELIDEKPAVKFNWKHINVNIGNRAKRDRPVAVATVCLPELKGLKVDGYAGVDFSGTFETAGEFSVDVEGVANVKDLDMSVGTFRMDVGGVANFSEGNVKAADKVSIKLDGVARIEDYVFRSDRLRMDIDGVADVRRTSAVFEKGRIKVDGVAKVVMDSDVERTGGKVERFAEAGDLRVSVDGTAKVDLGQLRCRNVNASSDGVGKLIVYSSGGFSSDKGSLSNIVRYGGSKKN